MTGALRMVFAHDWLNGMRGGEKCLELLCEAYPGAPIYTLFCEREKLSKAILEHPIHTTWLNHIPGFTKRYRNYLPLYPAAMESFRVSACDAVLSFNHCVAKGINKPKGAVHISYCFTPMRYAWGFFDDYFGRMHFVSKTLIKRFLEQLRVWDRDSAGRVDHFVAISQHIRKRIKDCYGRDSEVIYPPVNTRYYEPDHRVDREEFYLVISALVPYKRVDLAVLAARNMKKRLVIIGDGPEKKRLEAMAGPDTLFMGWQADEVLRDHYRRAKALLFPGEEDFGIVPAEMQACGGRVIAYGKGGALETVLDGRTGLFFKDLRPKGLEEAIGRFETINWDPDAPRKNALWFSSERFIMEMMTMIQRKLSERP